MNFSFAYFLSDILLFLDRYWIITGNTQFSVRGNTPLKFDFIGGLFSGTFSDSAPERLKIEILTIYASFLDILWAYFEISHEIKKVKNSNLGLFPFSPNLLSIARVSNC